MKKYLFSVVLAVAAIAMIGCNNGSGKQEAITKISLSEETLSLTLGNEFRLSVIYEPKTAQKPEVTWKTSNPEVATVVGGVVSGESLGEALITATYGELTATCKVSVKTAQENFTVGGYHVWNIYEDKPVNDSVYDVTLASEEVVKCRLYESYYILWDQDVLFDGSGLSGAGYIAIINAPTWLISEGEYKGYYVSSLLQITDDPEAQGEPYVSPAGGLTDEAAYLNWCVSYLMAETEDDIDWDAYEQAFKDPSFSYTLFDEEASMLTEAYITKGYIRENAEDQLQYHLEIDWLDRDSSFYGLGLIIQNDSVKGIKEPYELNTTSVVYELNPIKKEEVNSNKAVYPVFKEHPYTINGKLKKVNKFMYKLEK